MNEQARVFPGTVVTICFLLVAALGSCPAKAQSCGSTEPRRSPDGRYFDVVTKWDGIKAYRGASRSTEVARMIGFGIAFRVYNERSEWLCLGDAEKGRFVGWVSRNDLLTKRDARKDERTGVYIKIMVRNNLNVDSTVEWGKFWAHPTERKKHRKEAGIYEVRYVFDVQRSTTGGDPKYAYLVGSGQEWNIDNADKVLDGWIGQDYVFVWKTRVGAQYRTGLEEQVKIYPERDNLDAVFCENASLPWAFTSLDDDMEWPYDRERFPVLNEAKGISCLKRRHVLEIGAFGTVVLNKKKLTPAQGDHIVSTVSGLRGGNQNIDILFIIDGTESMQPAFVEAKKAVQKVKDLGALADARYALVMFKDRITMWPPLMTGRLLDAAGLTLELDRFMKEAGRDNRDRDFAESVLDGVQFGLEQMKDRNLWRNNSTRALILLGDHGDHDDAKHQSRLNSVLETLRQQKVRFFAYQTRNTQAGNTSADEAYETFQNDATAIIGSMADLFPKEVPLNRGDSQQIASALQEMRRWKRSIDDGYEAIRNGEVPPSEVGPYIKRMLSDSGFTLKEVMGYGQAPQVCHKGFTLLEDRKGREQFEKRIRISYSDVAKLTVAFRDFLSDTSSEQECLRSMKTALQAATGDKPREGETPAEFLERTLGIAVKSDLLTQTFEELARTLANSRTARDELGAELKRSVALLDAVYREEKVTVDARNGTVEVDYDDEGRAVRRPWFKTMPDGTRVAWIPTNYIP